MPSYKKTEAREWARENLRGVANVVIPSYTSDLKALNEAGIRHDIRKEIEYGFAGTLLVSEVVITLDEYRQFFEWANDESKGRLKLIFHASFNTLEETIEAAKIAESNGGELVLLSYPANFYPESLREVFDYTKAFCDATSMGVMLFPVPLWGFQRLSTSDIPAAMIRELIDACPNIVAVKAEGGRPTVMGVIECHRLFGKEIVVSCPVEGEMIPLSQIMPIQFSATSNTEYFGGMIPRIFKLLGEGNFDEATRLYWQIHPARKANSAASGYIWSSTSFIHRALWKYQGWLNGFNGGPMRQPTMRLQEAQMNGLRQALVQSGLEPDMSPFQKFFIGRNPVESTAARKSKAA